MLITVRNFFTPPIFPDDDDKTYTARVLYALLANMLGVLALGVIATVFVFVYKTRISVLILVLFCFLLISQALAQRGRVREASVFFVVGMWAGCTLMLVIGGRITTAFTAIQVAIAVIAGLLLGRRSAIVIAILSSLVSLGLAITQSVDYYPFGYSPIAPAISHWIMFVLALLLALTALNLTLQGSTQALALARENEAKFRLLAENSTDMISRHTPEGVYLYASPACHTLFGYEPEELIGHSAFEFINPDDMPIVDQSRTSIIDRPIISTTTFRGRKKNGDYIWLETTSRAILDKETGKVLEIHAATRDIDERKRAEEALRETESIFASFLEHSPVYIFFKDKDIRSLRLSRNYEQMLGMPLDQMLGKTMDELFPSDLAKSMVEDDLRILNQGQRVNVIEAFGGRVYETTKFPILKDGKPNMLAGFTLDITERKQVEEALQESEIKFRNLFENMNDGFALHKIILDENGKPVDYEFVEANPVFLNRVGMKAEDLIHHRALELFPKTEQSWIDTFGQVAITGQPVQFTNYSVELDKYYETRLYCPRPGYFAGLFSDVTERKQAEFEREKLIAELSAKNAELERFTYTVSHDLKSPIVTIRGFLGYLEEDAFSGNTVRMENDIRRITDATNKMQELLQDLLELSRIGRMMNAPETVQFEDLTHSALEILHGQLEKRRVTIQIHPNLPSIYGDRQRLTEVLQNLIDNAIKYTGDQPDPRIEIGQSGEENGRPIFFVKDNGIGIDPKYHDRIFGLFNKLDARSEGTGVGLALVKRIIEVHGGRIWVESESNMGSTFYFSLPTN